jgi:8-hydroxy-5-deazaflavin:NADPH oxidoreductase
MHPSVVVFGFRYEAQPSCNDARMPSTNDTSSPFPASVSANPAADPAQFGTVAVLGGTGPQGRGLARRFAAAGVPVVIGSRDAVRAGQAAEPMSAAGLAVTGEDNAGAAAAGDIVIVAVPYEGHEDLLKSLAGELAGKVVVDCVNPLGFDKQGAYQLEVPEGSAAQQAAAVLPQSTVVAAFHHVSAVLLEDESVEQVDTDVLVLGEDREATDLISRLADLVPGMRGVYAGRLRNAGQVEALTANLISINRRYKSHAGLRVTDVG